MCDKYAINMDLIIKFEGYCKCKINSQQASQFSGDECFRFSVVLLLALLMDLQHKLKSMADECNS